MIPTIEECAKRLEAAGIDISQPPDVPLRANAPKDWWKNTTKYSSERETAP